MKKIALKKELDKEKDRVKDLEKRLDILEKGETQKIKELEKENFELVLQNGRLHEQMEVINMDDVVRKQIVDSAINYRDDQVEALQELVRT